MRDRLDTLYQQAGAATQRYNTAKERTDSQRVNLNRLRDHVAREAGELNETRSRLGRLATERYRFGAIGPLQALLLSDDPDGYADTVHLLERLDSRHRALLTKYRIRLESLEHNRAHAVTLFDSLHDAQDQIRRERATINSKISEARSLLSRLTLQEARRLAALDKLRTEAASRQATQWSGRQEHQPRASVDTSTRGRQAIAFARTQLGKPYVWGATGPNSYDCSGLTQAAWGAAGVSLSRTTWTQVRQGTRVPVGTLRPGDLVFFYADISHVGLYIGNGRMIHAPRPGTRVREESIFTMPIHSAMRPA
ncbi:C40 family peptidase [Streptomyces zaomyceticus]|uniref:C40 family peptidase n=1 Tax=Streptomyces zaomyceticus TaxID=68286 RepID=UPI0036B44E0B